MPMPIDFDVSAFESRINNHLILDEREQFTNTVWSDMMTQANLEHFLNEVAESEELQSRIGNELTGEDLVALGEELVCERPYNIEAVGNQLRLAPSRGAGVISQQADE